MTEAVAVIEDGMYGGKKIIKPTVGEFIEFLKQYPLDAPLRISDPDTGWTITHIHAFAGQMPRQDIVWLSGGYHEMSSGDE